MKYIKQVLFSSLLFSTFLEAGEFRCTGKVTALMADHPGCVDETGKKQFAFKIGTAPLWKCSGSDTASSLLLSARLSDKALSVYLNDENGATCSAHVGYIKPNYIILWSEQ